MSDPLNHLGLIWYNSKPSEVPYYPNQYLDRDFFFHFLHQGGSSSCIYGEVRVLTTLFRSYVLTSVRWYYVAELSRNISGAPDFFVSETFLFYFNFSPDRTRPFRVSTS